MMSSSSEDEGTAPPQYEETSSDEDEEPAQNISDPHFQSPSTEFNNTTASSSEDDEPEPSYMNFKQSSETKSMARKRKLTATSSEDEEFKKSKIVLDAYSSKSLRMMQNMGYKADKGLGKSGQGRIEPIEASSQKGRRGLGLKLDGLDTAATNWDPALEVLNIPEIVTILVSDYEDLGELNRDLLSSWINVGLKKMTIGDEDKFCDTKILKNVLESKSVFDNLGANDMRKARTKSNPFETIKGNIFINRAAVKMANMDAVFDFMFTNPVDEDGQSLVKNDELLYFADVCAGPGGFTEYILWRKGWEAKGFGFTLKGDNDFKLHDFFAGHPETFDPYYGAKDNGDIFDPDNIEALTNYVLKQTEYGVHFMMADGGFSVEGQENVQEILSKQLYLCQILVALNIVRTKGHFVVKVFDLFTPFSVGLVYLVYKCFEQISIFKPNTSRPANSERYLICKWKKSNTDVIQRHLSEINRAMWENKDMDADTLELVPYDVLRADEKFFNYIYESNNSIGHNQIVGLMKIAAFSKDQNLNDTRQAEVKKKCLELWRLEDSMRKQPQKKTNDDYCKDLLKDWSPDKAFLADADKSLNGEKLDKIFSSINGWYFIALDVIEDERKNIRTFFMGKGGREVLQFNKITRSWGPLRDCTLELSPNTIIYGEIVKELLGEGKSQIVINALHIIDGIILGGKDIRKLPLKERNKMCEKFARAHNKPFKTVTSKDSQEVSTPIRNKKLIEFKDIDNFFNNLNSYKLKDGKDRLGYMLRNDLDPNRFFVPRGLLFLNEVRGDYLKMFSKSKNKFYYFEKKSGLSYFPEQFRDVSQTFASFRNTFVQRWVWDWREVHQVAGYDERKRFDKDAKLTYRTDIIEFILSKISN